MLQRIKLSLKVSPKCQISFQSVNLTLWKVLKELPKKKHTENILVNSYKKEIK